VVGGRLHPSALRALPIVRRQSAADVQSEPTRRDGRFTCAHHLRACAPLPSVSVHRPATTRVAAQMSPLFAAVLFAVNLNVVFGADGQGQHGGTRLRPLCADLARRPMAARRCPGAPSIATPKSIGNQPRCAAVPCGCCIRCCTARCHSGARHTRRHAMQRALRSWRSPGCSTGCCGCGAIGTAV
jgi:hypothetical protein